MVRHIWRVATAGLAAPRALHDDAARGATGQAPAEGRARRRVGVQTVGAAARERRVNILQLARRLTQRHLPIFAPHLDRPVLPAGPAVAQLLERVELARVHEVGDDHGS